MEFRELPLGRVVLAIKEEALKKRQSLSLSKQRSQRNMLKENTQKRQENMYASLLKLIKRNDIKESQS